MQPLKSMMRKVIILAHQENDNYKSEDNPFYELVNLGSNSIYFRQMRNQPQASVKLRRGNPPA